VIVSCVCLCERERLGLFSHHQRCRGCVVYYECGHSIMDVRTVYCVYPSVCERVCVCVSLSLNLASDVLLCLAGSLTYIYIYNI
jgi:hypothetical protein